MGTPTFRRGQPRLGPILIALAVGLFVWLVACPRVPPPPTVAPTRPLKRGVTLVTHMTPDRLTNLRQILHVWRTSTDEVGGPVVVVFLARSYKDIHAVRAFTSTLAPNSRLKSIVHLDEGSTTTYPVNTLRNLGLAQVETELCLVADGDLVPDPKMYSVLTGETRYELLLQRSKHAATVIPVFFVPASSEGMAAGQLPADKPSLRAAIKADQVRPPLDHPRRPHHAVTDYDRWATATEDYHVAYRLWYEPYLLMGTRSMPWFDPRFIYYGFDKVAYGYTLFRLGFQFWVLEGHFLTHMPHAAGGWQVNRDGTPKWQDEALGDLFDRFLHEGARWPPNWRKDWAEA